MRGRGAAAVLLPAAVGLVAAAGAVGISGFGYKQLLVVLAAVAVIPLAAVTRQARAIVLCAWILSLTYFRVSFPIPSMAGFQGFYVTVADGVFLLALVLWFCNIVFERRTLEPNGVALWKAALPLLLVCCISAALAQRSDWAGYEAVRVAKTIPILLFCRYNLERRQWWVAVCALGLALVAQTGLAILQYKGIIGNYQLEAWDTEIRPNGTLAHASIFSGYMLLLGPLFLALAIILEHRVLKALAALAWVMSGVGLILAMSRMPWLIAGVEALLLTVVLVGMNLVSLKRAIGVWSVAMVLAGLAVVPLLDRIRSRISSDLNTAVAWRMRMNEVGVAMLQEHTFFGIGLANFPLYLNSVNMEFSDSLDDAMSGMLHRAGAQGQQVKGFHWVWVPHNLYVLLAAETGVLGLLAFLLLVGSAMRAGLRAMRTPDAVIRAASAGILTGMLGVLAQMLTDWALWLDPLLYTFVVSAALLAAAPAAAARYASRSFVAAASQVN